MLVLLQAMTTYAQTVVNSSLQHYTDENGLPQNSVTNLAFDNAGFLWFSTNMGLVRFDGRSFMVWEKRHLRFTDPVVEHFVRDPQSNVLFVVSRAKELGILSNGKFVPLPQNFSDKDYRLGSVALKYLYGHVIPYAFHGTYYSYIIPAGNNSHYYLQGDTLTMYHNDVKVFSTRFKNNEAEPWRFFVVGETLYHLDLKGNIRQYGKTIKPVTVTGDLPKNKNYRKSGNEIRSVVNFTSGDVFIYLENSLYILNEDESGQLTSRLIATGFDFSDHAVSTICYDRKNDRVFVGSYTNGLFVLTNKQFTTLSVEEMGGGMSNSFLAQVPYGKNSVLTAGGSIFGTDGVDDYIYRFNKYSDGTSMLRDYEGNIITKHISDLYLWDKNADDIIKSWRLNRIISVIYAGIDSTIWVGAKTPGGLYRLDTKKRDAQPERIVPSMPDVTFIVQNNRDKVWIGTAAGLYTLNKTSGKIQAIQGLKGKSIRSLYADVKHPQNLWVLVEDDGIRLYRNDSLYTIPKDKENFMDDGRCMLLDSAGYFWITTGKGLFKAYQQDFIDYADKKIDRVYYSYYSKASGFNTNEFSGFCEPCGVRLDNGNFSFPSLNGLVLFNPYEVKAEYPDKEIYIDRIDVDGKSIFPDSITYNVKNDFKRLAIYYTTPYFGSGYNLNFETRFDGEEWQPVTSNPIVFTSLPTGKHQFFIRKIDGGGSTQYTVRMIEFDVPPAYWQTWWFITLFILGIGTLVYSYTRLRVIYITRRNRTLEESITERTQELKQTIHALKESKEIISRDTELQKRLTASIAHDVKTPLKYLLLTASSLSKIPASELENEQETIKTVYKSIYRIYYFTDNLLAYIKSSFNEVETKIRDAINLHMLVKEKVDIFNDVAASQSTELQNNIDDDLLLISNKNLLSIVIHNLIDNAVKFTFNGIITIKARQINGEIEITIVDTGVGIHPEQMESIQAFFESEDQKWDPGYNKHNGLGLVIIKETVKQLGGRILIDSEKDMGTTVVLYIPE